MNKIQGVIVSVFKHDKNTGFSIFQIKGTDEQSVTEISKQTKGKELLTVLGNYFNPAKGGYVTCDGYYTSHERWGAQFKAKSVFSTKAIKKNHPVDILLSSLMRNTDKKVKARLARKYGDRVLRVLNTDPDQMIREGVINADQLVILQNDWNRASKLFQTFNYLRGVGMERSASDRVIEYHGNDSKNIIANDPYLLLDVPGIGFSKIDQAASNMGMEMTSEKRVRHGINHLVNNFSNQGHTAINLEMLTRIATRDMKVDPSVVASLIQDEVNNSVYTIINNEKNEAILVNYNTYKREIDCAKELKRLIEAPLPKRPTNIRIKEDSLEKDQKNALLNALFATVTVITGGPGVGKTYTVDSIRKTIKEIDPGNRILMAAPTGKAARRIQESTGEDASTIHNMLDYHPEEGFRNHKGNKLEVDTVILDETSMVDIHLFYSTLKAIPTGARVVIVGDVDQLASVGPGAVLADIINSGAVKVSYLNEVMRQAKGSDIVVNAHRINNGLTPNYATKSDSDFHWIDADSDEDIMSVIKALSQAIPKNFGIGHDSIQVLSPKKDTLAGVNKLNVELREIMNPVNPKKNYHFNRAGEFRYNDRVMQIQNNKELDVNNGEVGKIVFINLKSQIATVDFDGVLKDLPFDNFYKMKHAYAKTIHKSQGSEYDVVIIPISESHGNLSVQLAYTALTRGKKHVFMVGSKAAMEKALKNKDKNIRNTLLDRALINEMGSSMFTPLYEMSDESMNVRDGIDDTKDISPNNIEKKYDSEPTPNF